MAMDALQPGDPGQVAGYRLLGRLGQGGMGQVFLGRSPGGRQVAVKIIHREHAHSPVFRDRFAREVEAARRVGGFHTAQVVDADPGADPPWMITAYIPGPSMQEAVAARGPLPPDQVRALAAGLAEGLAAIHACGLVHRDLKPQNVILAADGPRIIDFGIARPLDASAMTATGAVIGTYAYMSPEQVDGRPAGPPSDVFSLGAVLTFAATGRSPFAAASIPAVAHRITLERPELGGLPGDLHDLIAACLAKNPDDRPTLARLLGELGDRPDTVMDSAPPPPPGIPTNEPPPPGIRRRTILLAGLGAAAVAAVPVGVILTEGSHSRRTAKTPTPAPRRSPAYEATLAQHTDSVDAVAFSPDGKLLASGSEDDSVQLWSMAGRTRVGNLLILGDSDRVYSATFSPDGKTLATGTARHTIRLWDVASRTKTATLTGHTNGVDCVVFSPDGRTLASSSDDKTIRLWDVVGRGSVATLTGHTDTILTVAFSPDGRTLASGCNDKTIRLWDVASRTTTATLTGHTGGVGCVVFSPDGKSLASGAGDNMVVVWSVAERKYTAILTGHTDRVTGVAYSPDGRTLISCGDDRTVRLWDVASQNNTATLTGHTADVTSVAITPDGAYAATGSKDKTVRLWRLR